MKIGNVKSVPVLGIRWYDGTSALLTSERHVSDKDEVTLEEL